MTILFSSRALSFALIACALVVSAPAGEPAIIAKARAFLGSEEAEEGVRAFAEKRRPDFARFR